MTCAAKHVVWHKTRGNQRRSETETRSGRGSLSVLFPDTGEFHEGICEQLWSMQSERQRGLGDL